MCSVGEREPSLMYPPEVVELASQLGNVAAWRLAEGTGHKGEHSWPVSGG